MIFVQGKDFHEGKLKWLGIEASALKKHGGEKFKEGLKEGQEKGRKEEKLEIARSMFNENLSLEQISRLTGLSEKELKNLKE